MASSRSFRKSALYYDAVYDVIYDSYSGKDYGAESKRLRHLIGRHNRSNGRSLLDVPCGAGRHLHYLKAWFDVEGLDINGEMLALARKRNPGIRFHRGDIRTFKLRERFDVITCLFSAIGYMTTVAQLREAVRNMSFHLRAGGVLIVESWMRRQEFKSGSLHAVLVNQPKLKLARIGRSSVRGRTSIISFRYLVVTPKTTRCFAKSEKFGLFTHAEYLASFRAAGLKVTYYSKGLAGRGLYVGVKM